ncbi:MAG: hypothetical protein AMXMBFR7_35790 [Planctomycetota bacterium]
MKRTTMTVLGLVVLALAAQESYAMGGGRGGGFVAIGSDRKPIKSGDLKAVAPGHWDGKDQTVAQDGTAKPPLPEAIDIPALDTSRFDAIAEQLKLDDVQKQKLQSVKNELTGRREKLLTDQKNARESYLKSNNQVMVNQAAQEVVQSARACRQYDPNIQFTAELRRILTGEQYGTFRELGARK